MFQKIGTLAARYRKGIILGWVALAAALMVIAPNIEDVSSTDQADFLPTGAPFAHAQQVLESVFPEGATPTNTIVLIDAGKGGNVRDPMVWNFIAETEEWLNSDAAPDVVVMAAGPTNSPELADALISSDNRIALVHVPISVPMDSTPTRDAVVAIEKWLQTHEPPGIRAYQTGEAALNQQSEEAAFTTMDRTIVITIALVVVALLVIYRSPVSPLIPLFTVTIAFLVTLGMVAILADLGVMTAVTQVVTLLVVVMYGAGTDYCLFLISRFREEMADEIGVKEATRRTVHRVGETISSSAGTIFVGFVSVSFAEMGLFRSAGPMLAMGIAVSLLAGLTLAPALLAALGNRAFWPGRASHRSTGRFYELTSKLVSTRPLVTITIIAAIMVPFSVYGLTQDLNYDPMSELPRDIDTVKAYDLMRDHMGAGNLFPLTVVRTGREPDSLPQDIAHLEARLDDIDGVDDLRSLNTPLGKANRAMQDLLRVDGQLLLLVNMGASESQATPGDTQQAAAIVSGMQRYADMLLEQFPELATDEHFLVVQDVLNDSPESMAERELELMSAVAGLIQRFRGMEDAYLFPPVGEGELYAVLKPLVDNYVANGDTAYRIEIALDNPLDETGMDSVRDIRDVLASVELSDDRGEAVVSGFTALFTDIQDVMARDQMRIYCFILTGIFVVLLLMLRSAVAPVYLIGTVVLSFTCTLGLTNLFFDLVYDINRLSWMLPIFMFVFLVALGIDYSIFLFGRIKEEVAKHGVREGVHVAVAATGAIITSAGIILAGTFAGMMVGDMMLLKQLGFAVSVGVLIDTFVVRTVLDPALAAAFGRWTWWPGAVPKIRESSKAGTAAAAPSGD